MEEVINSSGVREVREKNTAVAQPQNIDLPEETAPKTTKNPILQVNHLRVGFPIKGIFGQTQRLLMAVNDVSFKIKEGESFGLPWLEQYSN